LAAVLAVFRPQFWPYFGRSFDRISAAVLAVFRLQFWPYFGRSFGRISAAVLAPILAKVLAAFQLQSLLKFSVRKFELSLLLLVSGEKNNNYYYYGKMYNIM
jgi:ABC-type glycerol-3-phosphate transport system permease component